MNSTTAYDTLALNYKNLTTLYSKHADVNKKLRQKLREFRINLQKRVNPTKLPRTAKKLNKFGDGSRHTTTTAAETANSNSLITSSLNHVTHKIKNLATNILPSSLTDNVVKKGESGANADEGGGAYKSLDEEEKFEPAHSEDPIDSNGLGTIGHSHV